MTSEVSKQPQRALSTYLRSEVVKAELIASVGKNRADQVVASLMSLVNSNIVLQSCDPKTVFAAAMTAAALDLPINPSLGQAYIIPFNNKVKVGEKEIKKANGEVYMKPIYEWQKQAQFQMGYKGFVQLGLRSGKYKTMHAGVVKEGEFQGENHLTGELEFAWEKDAAKRAKLETAGFVAYIELTTGFSKSLYMSVEEVTAHAKKYSKSFADGYGQWADNFDGMAKKTVLKLLIDKWGIKTTAIERALVADQAVMEDENDATYADNKDGKAYVDVEPPVDNQEETAE